MNDILEKEAAIVVGAADRFLALGEEAATRVLDGKFPDEQDEKAATILLYFNAYNNKLYLTTRQLEVILYVLWQYSELGAIETIDPLTDLDAARFHDEFFDDNYD